MVVQWQLTTTTSKWKGDALWQRAEMIIGSRGHLEDIFIDDLGWAGSPCMYYDIFAVLSDGSGSHG